MARCSKMAALVISGFSPSRFLKPSASLSRLPRSCCSWKLEFGLFTRLSFISYSSIAMSPVEEDTRNHPFKYNWIDGVESLKKYKPGGYHPIMIGDILHSRYRIVDKLGFGGYSTVWLARDTCSERYVAVKVGVADSSLRETNILRALSAPLPSASPAYPGHSSIPLPLDEFKLNGPNGTHLCYTMTM
jgi:hypothetical protein